LGRLPLLYRLQASHAHAVATSLVHADVSWYLLRRPLSKGRGPSFFSVLGHELYVSMWLWTLISE
jgi:hypothetical protein